MDTDTGEPLVSSLHFRPHLLFPPSEEAQIQDLNLEVSALPHRELTGLQSAAKGVGVTVW